MLFYWASWATLMLGCIDCATSTILKSQESWEIVIVCERQEFRRKQELWTERTNFWDA